MPAVQNAVLGSVAPVDAGKASGIFNMFRFLGGAFGIATMSAAFAQTGGFATPVAFSHGFVAVLAVAVVLSLASVAAGFGLPGRKKLALQPKAVSA